MSSCFAPVLRKSKLRRINRLGAWRRSNRADVLRELNVPVVQSQKQPKSRSLRCRAEHASSVWTLALMGGLRSVSSQDEIGKPLVPPAQAAKPKLDVEAEVTRILSAESAEDVLNLASGESSEEVISQTWKQLVLLLHPDKLLHLDEEKRAAGAEALFVVHKAKEDLKERIQKACGEVPTQPRPDGRPRLLNGASGARTYEVKWSLPDSQDPKAPVERYEVWGPKYFSEAGDPFDWVLLSSLPPLQPHFVITEEAPTQQDV